MMRRVVILVMLGIAQAACEAFGLPRLLSRLGVVVSARDWHHAGPWGPFSVPGGGYKLIFPVNFCQRGQVGSDYLLYDYFLFSV